jgi:hypothetical protein
MRTSILPGAMPTLAWGYLSVIGSHRLYFLSVFFVPFVALLSGVRRLGSGGLPPQPCETAVERNRSRL